MTSVARPPCVRAAWRGMPVALAGDMAKSRRKEYAAAPPSGDTTTMNTEPDRVAQRAYELYLARGGGDGRDMDDWLSAERGAAGSPGAAATEVVTSIARS